MSRIVGLDLGSRTLGIAISCPLKMIASGVETYRFKEENYDDPLNYVIEFCKKNDVDRVILGLPKHMNGDIGDRAQICLDFAKKLEENSSLSIKMVDERLTTVLANKRLLQADLSRKKRKEVIDKMAAVVILQGYLDSKSC